MDNLWIIYLQIPESGGGPRISRNSQNLQIWNFWTFSCFLQKLEFLDIFVFLCNNSTPGKILKKRDFVQKPGSAPGIDKFCL